MEFKWLLYISIAASAAVTSAFSSCERTLVTNCNYTITCDQIPMSVSNPTCDGDPFVTFIIKNSYRPHISTSFFASTNFDTRVRVFKAYDNSWDTIEDAAFRYYHKCIRMEIINSHLITLNNEAFKYLNYLRHLNLSNNDIETIQPKSFLISDSKSNSLLELDLSNNLITSLGSELRELPNLRILYLQNNKLSILADDAFLNLKNLNELYLQNNRLTGLNLTLINLKKLTVLKVSYNYLMQLPGIELNRLNSLVEVNMSHNQLSFVESTSFNQAADLEVLDLSYNKINIVIEQDMFKNNSKLRYLDLFSNNITGIEERFLENCDIHYLNLEENNITGDITYQFHGLDNLLKLSITNQSLTGIRHDAFLNMKQLISANLSRNSIGIVEINSFHNSSIQELDLSYNNINNLKFIRDGLENLTSLYLNNNNISVVPKGTFKGKSQITYLDISMNNIVTIEANSLPLTNLQYFYIQGNRLGGSLKKNVLSPARYLRFLDLSSFNLTRIESMALVNLPVLVRLNLSNNQIQDIESDNFIGVDNLFSLDLSNNKLSSFKIINGTLKNLKALYLNSNELSNITEIFPKRCELIYLDMSQNNITELTGLENDTLPNLTTLHLEYNKIKHFNNDKTNTLTSLIDLRLSTNLLNDITLKYFSDLLSVDLSNNNLTVINHTFLENVNRLQSLDVSRNNITDLLPGTFKDMTTLKLLNLSSNYLTRLRYGSLKGLHKTEVLDVSRNMITELDVDLFHECVELTTLIIDYNQIKIFDVERLVLLSHKLRKLSLGGNPISCKEIIRNVKSVNMTYSGRGQVEVTSIDKVYHEDNVHGIKCGDGMETPTTMASTTNFMDQSDSNDTSVSIIAVISIFGCLTLLAIIVVGGVVYFKMQKSHVMTFDRTSRASLELSGTEYRNDLLN